MNTSFTDRLRGGEVLVGTFVSSASAVVADLLADCGLDWLLVDAEHGVADLAAAALCIRLGLPRTPVLVRVSPTDRRATETLLDAGATGIVIPRAESAEEVAALIASTSYLGTRGLARAVPRFRWGADTVDVDTADTELARIVQIETFGALRDVERIAEFDRVDALFIGPADLDLDLRRRGYPLPFADAVERVVSAARLAGKAAGTLVPGPEAISDAVAQGYRLLVAGSDLRMLADRAGDISRLTRAARANTTEEREP